MKIILPEYAERIISRLNSGGFEAFIVGGCVRDALRGAKPNDFDMTTSALPEQIKGCFPECRTIDTGIKHGTVTVLFDGIPVEITTFRRDGEYDDNRHPRQVTFTPHIEDDLARRDFTVNAMAYSPSRGIVDLFGGQVDLEKGIIRCVGNPDLRFSEDGLRIIRGLRFASVLGYEIEPNTAESIHRNRALLANIAVERLYSEFVKLICGRDASRILRGYYDVIGVFIPEILPMVGFNQRTKYHCFDVYEHTMAVIDAAAKKADSLTAVNYKYLMLSAFFHDIAKPQCFSLDENGGHFYGHPALGAQVTEEILRRLHADGDTVKKVSRLVKEHCRPIEPSERAVRRFLNTHAPDDADLALELDRADRLGCAPDNRDVSDIDKVVEMIAAVRAQEACLSLKTLAVRGGDITALGYSGREVGQILSGLLDSVLDGRLPNEKQALLDTVKNRDK